MTNEADIPLFAGGLTPIGQIANPQGMPVAPKKAASGLLKRIMAIAHPPGKAPRKGKSQGRRAKARGIESDQKVHFGTRRKYY